MWMTKAGGDPGLVPFDRYPGRFPMVHVKDIDEGGCDGQIFNVTGVN